MTSDARPTGWFRRLWMLLLGIQSLLLFNAISALVRGLPDAYPNQHLRLAVHAVFGICLAAGYLARRPVAQYAFLAISLAALVAGVVLG